MTYITRFTKTPDGVRCFQIETDEGLINLPLLEAAKLRAYLNAYHHYLSPEKDWTTCPYETHADDCNCRGMGGDR